MNDIDPILKEKLLKIKALAEQGIGGEGENAKNMLQRLCDQNGIHLDDLKDTYKLDLEYKSTISGVINNIIYSGFGSVTFKNKYNGRILTWDKKVGVEAEGTAHEMLELKTYIEHYVDLYNKNRKMIMDSIDYGFCHKYRMRDLENDHPDKVRKPSSGNDTKINIEMIEGLAMGMKSDSGPRVALN